MNNMECLQMCKTNFSCKLIRALQSYATLNKAIVVSTRVKTLVT